MDIQDDVISLLQGKVKQVIQVAEGYKSDNEQLKLRIDELIEQLYAKSQEIEVIESKYQSLKLAKALTSSSEDVGNAKQKINRMVREIDKCIALLNK